MTLSIFLYVTLYTWSGNQGAYFLYYQCHFLLQGNITKSLLHTYAYNEDSNRDTSIFGYKYILKGLNQHNRILAIKIKLFLPTTILIFPLQKRQTSQQGVNLKQEVHTDTKLIELHKLMNMYFNFWHRKSSLNLCCIYEYPSCI